MTRRSSICHALGILHPHGIVIGSLLIDGTAAA